MARKKHPTPTSEAIKAYHEHVDRLIDEHGWAVLAVLPDIEQRQPGFSYTVGLTARSHPELLVFAMAADDARLVLNRLARKVLDGTVPLHTRLPEVLEGYDPVLVSAATERAHAFVMGATYRYGEAVTVLQLVLPDSNNKLPWETGYDAAMARVQPLLSD